MASIDVVFKKYETKSSDKKASLSVKLDVNIYNDINTVCNHLGITKSQLVIDIIEASGLSKKAEEIYTQGK